MRLIRGATSAVGLLAFAGACATSTGGTLGAPGDIGAANQGSGESLTRSTRDSLLAESVADREGPSVSVHAEYGNVSGSRELRADFHLDDDAYVVVGHLDADGVVRIVFPADPADDGFLHGKQSYKTNQFFAGFTDEYAYRLRNSQFHYTAATPESYDGGLGYVFVIASWRPMHFEKFNTNGEWDTYELTDLDYMTDPRPAIYDLAALLAGNNPEAYTVKFARYYNSQSLYGDAADLSSANGLGWCAGYEPFGYASSPFDSYFDQNLYGENVLYRGTPLLYDALGDCYREGFIGLGFASFPFASFTPTTPQLKPRALSPFGPRKPVPPLLKVHRFAQRSPIASDAAHGTVTTSSAYRARGLLTTSDPAAEGGRPSVAAHADAMDASHARPSIQEMIRRHNESAGEASARAGEWPSARPGVEDGNIRRMSPSMRSPAGESERPQSGRTYERPSAEPSRSEPMSRPAPSAHPEPTRSAPPPRSEPSRSPSSSGRASAPSVSREPSSSSSSSRPSKP